MTVKEFINLPKQKVGPRERMRRLIQSIRDSLVIEENNEQSYESGNCCNKIAFDSEREAMDSITGMKKNSKRPVRAYKCGEGKWHLTSMRKDEYRNFNNHLK